MLTWAYRLIVLAYAGFLIFLSLGGWGFLIWVVIVLGLGGLFALGYEKGLNYRAGR